MSANQQGDNENGGGGKSGGGASTATWGTKAGYVGTGILIGLIIYPFVRKAITKVQPKMDKFFDDLTGKAEGMAEKAADLMARAKDNLASHEHDHDHGPGHAHPHSHEAEEGPVKGRGKSTIQ